MINFQRIFKFLTLPLILLTLHNTYSADTYKTRVELELKGGNKRHILRPGVLIPIYQNQSTLIFTPLFFMGDSKYNFEGNFGLGMRHKIRPDWILGGYTFFDVRKIHKSKKRASQMTYGAEVMSSGFEARFNWYQPTTSSFLLSTNKTTIVNDYDNIADKTIRTKTDHNSYDFILKGFDIEVGGCLAALPELNTFASFYYFSESDIKIKGGRIRSNYRLFSWLTIDAEYNYDNERKSVYYLGASVRHQFGKKSIATLKRIDQKMTQLPTRDIDLIVRHRDNVLVASEKALDGFVPEILSPEVKIELNIHNISLSGNAVLSSILEADDVVEIIRSHGVANYSQTGSLGDIVLLSTNEDNINQEVFDLLERYVGQNTKFTQRDFIPKDSKVDLAINKEHSVGKLNVPVNSPLADILPIHTPTSTPPTQHVKLNIFNLVKFQVNDETTAIPTTSPFYMNYYNEYSRLATAGLEPTHNCYGTIKMPKVLMLFPYNPDANARIDGGLTRTLLSIKLNDIALPANIVQILTNQGVTDNNIEVFIVAQTQPWNNGTNVLLRPHPWLHPNAKGDMPIGTPNPYGLNTDTFTRKIDPITGNITEYNDIIDLATGLPITGFSTHGDNRNSPPPAATVADPYSGPVIFSGPTHTSYQAPATGNLPVSRSEFSVVIQNPNDSDLTRRKTAVTFHMMLSDPDTVHLNGIVGLTAHQSSIHDFVDRFNGHTSPFLNAQFDTLKDLVKGPHG